MSTPELRSKITSPSIPNGSGAAAILAAGFGCFVLSLLAFAGDKSPTIKNSLNIYKPTGALSGVTLAAILTWLLAWTLLEWQWKHKTVSIGRITMVALILLALSFILTFPPVVDFL